CRSGAVIVRTDPIFHQRGFPAIGEDGWPEQPETPLGIDQKTAVGVGIAGCVRHCETSAPGAFVLVRAFDFDVISRAFTRTMKPANYQVAFWRFDDAGGMVVPVFERENDFGSAKGFSTLNRPERSRPSVASQQQGGEQALGNSSDHLSINYRADGTR